MIQTGNVERGKFRSKNHSYISTHDKINANELENHLSSRILKKDLLAGIHHGRDNSGKAITGHTDFALLQGFYHQVFTKLMQLKDDKERIIWKDMGYTVQLVPITSDLKKDGSTYVLSDLSKRVLDDLGDKLCEQTRPFVLVFASCFSEMSNINDVLNRNGIISTLNLSIEKGLVTNGRVFALDSSQREVLRTVKEVLVFCL